MDWNSAVCKKLMAFHRAVREEYVDILDHFNLYVYGYGYKKGILEEIYPNAMEIDFSDMETAILTRMIYEYYGMEPKDTDIKTTMQNINKNTKRNETDKVIIVYNARKDVIEGIHNIKIVLMQTKELYMSYDELIQENYVMRDMTTFLHESKTKTGKITKIDEIINTYDCVGPLSKKAFKAILRGVAQHAEFSLRDIYNKEKKKLLLVSYTTFREALAPFIDSKVVIETNGKCKASLKKKELADLMDILDKTE